MAKFGAVLLLLLKTALILCTLWVIVLLVSALLVDTGVQYDKVSPYYRFLLNSTTAAIVWLLGIRVHISGEENLPANARFLLVGNHRSKFDPILTWYALNEHTLAFVSKPENFNIPIFGRIIRRCCFMPIDRENARSAFATINFAAGLIEADAASVAVYPEGTRSLNGELLPFHNGVFKIAQKADVPVVVAAVSGTERIHKNVFRRKTDVYITIADVISADVVKSSRTAVIGERVRNTLEEALNSMEGNTYAELCHNI